jgi:hypothetical protein
MGVSGYYPTIPLSDVVPLTAGVTAAAAGTALLAARGDHRHAWEDSGWIVPTFQNSWVAYSAPWAPVGYRKIGNIVILRGLIAAGSSISAVMFNLPAGYRPTAGFSHIFAVQSADALARLEVHASGNVNASNGSTSWVSLSGVSFVADT